jgi:hypothetical protein
MYDAIDETRYKYSAVNSSLCLQTKRLEDWEALVNRVNANLFSELEEIC